MGKIKVNLQIPAIIAGLVFSIGSGRIAAQHEHHTKIEPTNSAEKRIPEQITPENNPQKEFMENRVPALRKNEETEKTPATVSMNLAELERLALENNPTLKQSDFSIRAAEGRKTQAGLLPNPIVGVSGEDLSFRNFSDGGRVSFFIEQKIPLGGKPQKSRRVFEQEIVLAETFKERQRTAVLNSVRLLYLDVLGAQKVADLKRDLEKLAAETVETEAELYNIGLADRPDQLKTEIAQQSAQADYLAAMSNYEAAWQKLAALIGVPAMRPVRLSGNPSDFLGEIDSEELLAKLLAESPEIKAARIKVERAKLALKRARAEKIPDLYLRGGIGYNDEIIEDGIGRRRAGAEGFFEVGVTLPIFNRNQGGIKTAEAELAIAESEVDRLRLALSTKFAEVLRNYRNSVFRADQYRTQIVPKAKAAYEIYSANFQNMTGAYPKVLTARAAYLQAEVEYARNLIAAQRSMVLLKGFLLAGGLNSSGEAETGFEGASRIPTTNLFNDDDDRK